MNTVLQRFCDFYGTDFAQADLTQLALIYSEDVTFCDPAHQIEGLNALTAYFSQLAKHLMCCAFNIEHIAETDTDAYIKWTMEFRHPRLQRGKPISVPGVSYVRFDQKINFHRDYFDLGAMLYEHLPLLGGVVRLIKHRLGQ